MGATMGETWPPFVTPGSAPASAVFRGDLAGLWRTLRAEVRAPGAVSVHAGAPCAWRIMRRGAAVGLIRNPDDTGTIVVQRVGPFKMAGAVEAFGREVVTFLAGFGLAGRAYKVSITDGRDRAPSFLRAEVRLPRRAPSPGGP
jgi:hypothetical protein